MREPSALIDALRKTRAAWGSAWMLAALLGCGKGVWPDRDPVIVDGIRVDSLKFLPSGSRFVLEDSLTSILFRKFRPGYLCSRILKLDAEPLSPPALPRTLRP
jgi:hypothetical protein